MEMGHTLYLGSKDSDVYFCIYEKAQEQKAKFGKSIEDADILNRFELRLTNNAAENSADVLMDSEDAAGTAFPSSTIMCALSSRKPTSGVITAYGQALGTVHAGRGTQTETDNEAEAVRLGTHGKLD